MMGAEPLHQHVPMAWLYLCLTLSPVWKVPEPRQSAPERSAGGSP